MCVSGIGFASFYDCLLDFVTVLIVSYFVSFFPLVLYLPIATL